MPSPSKLEVTQVKLCMAVIACTMTIRKIIGTCLRSAFQQRTHITAQACLVSQTGGQQDCTTSKHAQPLWHEERYASVTMLSLPTMNPNTYFLGTTSPQHRAAEPHKLSCFDQQTQTAMQFLHASTNCCLLACPVCQQSMRDAGPTSRQHHTNQISTGYPSQASTWD